MNSLLEQLHDIEGLDHISWWPLGIGWWVVMGVGLLFVGFVVCYVGLRIAYHSSWKYETLQRLANLEMNLSDATARETAMILSEYLRRIALRRFSRKECAGLAGEDWLKWLSKNDPKNFDWENKGILLLDAPYAPLNKSLSSHQIKDLIQAVRDWIR
jgi:Domain of unknown function (DUF4381)